jgi:hypothetical protein
MNQMNIRYFFSLFPLFQKSLVLIYILLFLTFILYFLLQLVCLPVGETAVDICAAENFSFILSDTGAIFGFGSDDKNKR